VTVRTTERIRDTLGIEQTVRHEAGSAVPCCFVRELHAGGESEFGVDVLLHVRRARIAPVR